MAGAPPDYNIMHLNFHSWMLTDGSYTETDKEERGSGGILAITEQLLESTMTPWSNVEIYDPTATGEVYDYLLDRIKSFNDALEELDLLGLTSDGYDSLKSTVSGDVDLTGLTSDLSLSVSITPIDVIPSYTIDDTIEGIDSTLTDDLIDAFALKSEAALYQNISSVNKQFSALGTLRGSQRGVALGIIFRDYQRSVDEFAAKVALDSVTSMAQIKQRYEELKWTQQQAILNYQAVKAQLEELKIKKAQLDIQAETLTLNSEAVKVDKQLALMDKLLSLSFSISELSSKHNHLDLAAIEMLAKVCELYTGGKRQAIEDEIRVNTEEALWEFKVYEQGPYKALSAISGASVLPYQPNPTMEVASMALQAVGLLMPIFG